MDFLFSLFFLLSFFLMQMPDSKGHLLTGCV